MEYCLSAGDGAATMWDRGPDLDLNGDGRLDAVSLDFDGDGLADDALADLDGDGIADHAVLDVRRHRGKLFHRRRLGHLDGRRRPSERDRQPGLRWFGLDGVEHTGRPLRFGPTSAPRAVPSSGCSTATATGWPTARSRPATTA